MTHVSFDQRFRGCLLGLAVGDALGTTLENLQVLLTPSLGAVYGQLAGVFYGVDGIPREWRDKIAMRSLIEEYAGKLLLMLKKFAFKPMMFARCA